MAWKSRKSRFDTRQKNAAETKTVNLKQKTRERASRERRMLAYLAANQPPYPPHVTSWLSLQAGVKGAKITPETVQQFLANRPK